MTVLTSSHAQFNVRELFSSGMYYMLDRYDVSCKSVRESPTECLSLCHHAGFPQKAWFIDIARGATSSVRVACSQGLWVGTSQAMG